MPSTQQAPAPDAFGTQEERTKFITHLRDVRRLTQSDIAIYAGYGLDSVKAWTADNPSRKRDIPDRALAMLLYKLGMSGSHYLAIISAAE